MTPQRAYEMARREATCPKCGAHVLKPKKHKKWHARNKPIPGPPGPMGPMGMSGRDAS